MLRVPRPSTTTPSPSPVAPVISTIDDWNDVRLGQLWKVQGLSPVQIEGGMQTRQATHLLDQLAVIRKNGIKIKNICETGFFRGGSSLFWLMMIPGSSVRSFDLGANPQAIQWMNDRFPDRFVFYGGRSDVTVPGFAVLYPGWCDLVLIDGSHEGLGPYIDIVNFKRAAHKDTVIFADDTFDMVTRDENSPPSVFLKNHPCSLSWKRAMEESIITSSPLFPKMCDTFGMSQKWPLGHCVGIYKFN